MNFKKNVFILSFIMLSSILVNVFAVSDTIQAGIVDFKIMYRSVLNEKLSFPLILYNDNTYMSVRDVASLINKSVVWDDDAKQIRFIALDKEESVIKKSETALDIGKAIIKEYYDDRINENSKYYVSYAEPFDNVENSYWFISAVFRIDNDLNNGSAEEYILTNPDVRVEIDPLTCNFRLLERTEGSKFNTIVDFN